MIEHGNGFIFFGFFEGSPYGAELNTLEDFDAKSDPELRDFALKRFEKLRPALTSAPTYDIFTGEEFQAGLYEDGPFVITTDFVRYYKQDKYELPEEYAQYLLNLRHSENKDAAKET